MRGVSDKNPDEFTDENIAELRNLVMPVFRKGTFQNLVRITSRNHEEFVEDVLCKVRFVPLIGDAGVVRFGTSSLVIRQKNG